MRRALPLTALLVIAAGLALAWSSPGGSTVRMATAATAHTPAPASHTATHAATAPTAPMVTPAPGPGGLACQIEGDCGIHPCVQFVGAASASAAPAVAAPAPRPASCDRYGDRRGGPVDVVSGHPARIHGATWVAQALAHARLTLASRLAHR